MKHLLPKERIENIVNALDQTFGSKDFSKLTPLKNGYSESQMFLFEMKEIPYVLRIMSFEQPLEDRQTQIDCAVAVSQIGIGPTYYYANASTGIIIMEYIHNIPFSKSDILKHMPVLLKKLHTETIFPAPYAPIFPYIHNLMGDVLAFPAPEKVQEFLKSISTIISILKNASPSTNSSGSCHNDLNPDNILFDGNRFYLVDFEAAGTEDPFFDLATACMQMMLTPSEEEMFLKSYLKQQPLPEEMKKLSLMKQVSYAFYALHFFKFAYEEGVMAITGSIPTFSQWNEGMDNGTFELQTPQGFLLYATVLMEESLNNTKDRSYLSTISGS